ncbi:MAG: alpha/beta hydrolase [Planctomycetaceae bacterium]
MTDVPSTSDHSPQPHEARKPRTWRRAVVRGAVVYVAVPYLAIAALIAVFQRSLIYQPTRAAVISAEAGRTPSDSIHNIAVRTHDGLELNGWHCLAAGCTAKDAAECDRELRGDRLLVLYFPGNGGNRSHRSADCRDFSQLGANVFLVDYRGYGDNAGSPSEDNFVADARSIWKYATERGVDPDRIVLFGESLGGGVATRLAAELCESGTPPAGLILSSTFSSLVDTAGWHYPYLPVRLLLRDQYPSVQRAPSITCPVLQIHGGRDTIVPIEFGRRLSQALPQTSANGVQKRFVELPNAGHNDIPSADFAAAVSDFFESIRAAQGSAKR